MSAIFTEWGGYLILLAGFLLYVCVIIAVLGHDWTCRIERMDDERDDSMAKGMEYGDFPAGGGKPFGPEAKPKGRAGGKTGMGGMNKLPKHAVHPRGKERGMGKKKCA